MGFQSIIRKQLYAWPQFVSAELKLENAMVSIVLLLATTMVGTVGIKGALPIPLQVWQWIKTG